MDQSADDSIPQSEFNYKRLIDDAPLAIIRVTIEGKANLVNPAFARMFGYQSPQECLDSIQNTADLFADPMRGPEIIRLIQEHPGITTFENLYFRKDGSTFWGNLNVRRVENREGSSLYFEGFIEDITERKQSEIHLSQLTKRYQDLYENSGTNIIIVDENGTYLMVNRKAAENFGKPPGEVIGKSMFDLLSMESAAKYLKLNRQLLELGGHREYEDTFSLPGGEKTFLIVDQCIQDENHKNFAIQSSSIDITERKKAEEGLRESRERLSHLSYHMVQSQEQERRRIARELHDEIGQTLTAMNISLDGIYKFALDSVVIKKVDNLKSLAQELFAQVNALSSELRPRVLDDLGLVPGLISLINRLTTQTGMEIDFKHGLLEQKQIPPEIEITAYRIIQEALTNIVRHANVKLAIVRIQIDQDTLWIQVQDEGKGFDYQTAINSSSSMGLMSMLERAEQVGGLFSIQSAPGEGTNITCRLPLGEVFIERRKHERN